MNLKLKFYRVYSIPYKFYKFKLNLNKLQKTLLEWAKPICPCPSRPRMWSLLARGRSRGSLLPRRHRWVTDEIRPAGCLRAAVEWPRSKTAGWWTGLVAEEMGGAHRKPSLRRRGSATGKRRRQAGVGVTGRVWAVGEDVLSGVVLGVGSRGLEEG
jgi:hypothetical protein